MRANRFCERYGLQKSMRFSVTLFGDNVACSLEKVWCSRLQFFFDEFQYSGYDGHIFDERAGGGWVPPADFSAIQTGADAGAQPRCAQNRLRSCLGPLCEMFVVRA